MIHLFTSTLGWRGRGLPCKNGTESHKQIELFTPPFLQQLVFSNEITNTEIIVPLFFFSFVTVWRIRNLQPHNQRDLQISIQTKHVFCQRHSKKGKKKLLSYSAFACWVFSRGHSCLSRVSQIWSKGVLKHPFQNLCIIMSEQSYICLLQVICKKEVRDTMLCFVINVIRHTEGRYFISSMQQRGRQSGDLDPPFHHPSSKLLVFFNNFDDIDSNSPIFMQ